MIRMIRFLLLAGLGLALITMALANRTAVVVQWLPADLSAFLGVNWAMEVPLFLVIFAAMIAGLLIGFVWEWLREHKHRSVASTASRDLARAERELAALRDAKGQQQDDVLALLDRPRKAG